MLEHLKLTDPAEILEAAADVLETKGWGQGCEFKMENGERTAFCAIGAIREVIGFYNIEQGIFFTPAANLAHEAMNLSNRVAGLMHTDQGSVVGFNDEPGRTADEVIDLFKLTAKDLRNRGSDA
jgi:hypothetical protein